MLIVIPARGGSTGVRRKNLLPIGGEPAFVRSARISSEVFPDSRVVVATDDAEIAAVATRAGYEVFDRGPELAEVPVNNVVRAVAGAFNWAGEVMLVQPTVQPLSTKLLDWFYSHCDSRVNESLAVGFQEPHQTWLGGVRLTPPLERQEAAEWPVREAGIRWWPKAAIIWHADNIIVHGSPITDIDTWTDYQTALQVLNIKRRSTVTFMPLANETDGRGHLYRCLALAPLFGGHRVLFHPAPKTEAWAIKLIQRHGWKTTINPVKSDLVINDRLYTTREDIYEQREWADYIVNLEDQGTGADAADLTINALYEDGGDWAVVRPEFLVADYDLMREPTGKVLVLLNSDPSGMLQDVVTALDPWFEVSYMVPSDIPLAVAMAETDVLVTSGGRTVYEAAALGVPTVVVPQHEREWKHSHIGGNRNLVAEVFNVREAVTSMMTDRALRVRCSANGRLDGLGGQRIVAACEWLMSGFGPGYVGP